MRYHCTVVYRIPASWYANHEIPCFLVSHNGLNGSYVRRPVCETLPHISAISNVGQYVNLFHIPADGMRGTTLLLLHPLQQFVIFCCTALQNGRQLTFALPHRAGSTPGLLHHGQERLHGDQVPLTPAPRWHRQHGLPSGHHSRGKLAKLIWDFYLYSWFLLKCHLVFI